MNISKFLSAVRQRAGFTMIELLIVISILGILAVAVLSAINPIEQINRGRDTGSRSDAEQLLSAMDRFNAFQGYYPFVTKPNEEYAIPLVDGDLLPVTMDWTATGTGAAADCAVLDKLSQGDSTATDPCVASDELKLSFIQRITSDTYNSLYVYNRGQQGDSTYVCFHPQSGAFKTEAKTRCESGLPQDIDGATEAVICNEDNIYICLP